MLLMICTLGSCNNMFPAYLPYLERLYSAGAQGSAPLAIRCLIGIIGTLLCSCLTQKQGTAAGISAAGSGTLFRALLGAEGLHAGSARGRSCLWRGAGRRKSPSAAHSLTASADGMRRCCFLQLLSAVVRCITSGGKRPICLPRYFARRWRDSWYRIT